MAARIALTIAGSDSGGGAGIQADLKTFSALGVYGASVITALTAQNTRGVQGIHDVPAPFVSKQIDSVFDDLRIDAVKIGMLSQSSAIAAVAAGLMRHAARNIVVDPVMVATSGDRLLSSDAIAAMKELLFPLATVITPNLHEAAALLDMAVASSEAEMQAQGEALLDLGVAAVLIKGGHGEGPAAVDLLLTREGGVRLAVPRIPTDNTHGTGCTLSAAIAAGLASRLSLSDAVAAAKSYVTAAIAASDRLAIGHGHGPMHHFHAWW